MKTTGKKRKENRYYRLLTNSKEEISCQCTGIHDDMQSASKPEVQTVCTETVQEETQAVCAETVHEEEGRMDIREAVYARHSVRQYKDLPIAEDTAAELERLIRECNEESGLSIQLIRNDPECFRTLIAHYGKFKNVNHYIAIVGPRSMKDLSERGGYYGEKLVIAAQMLGLRTCWVAGSYGRSKCKAVVNEGEKIVCVISIGYGENDGRQHRNKSLSRLCTVPEAEMPDWFREGVRAAMAAPTAVNQQRFCVSLQDGEPVITAPKGFLTMLDLGIVKYNFEAVSGHKCK